MSELNFDANTVSPRSSFDPLPPGWYAMRITGAEIKESDTAGAMLKIEHEIDEAKHPERKGRRVWSNLCLNHPTSEEAKEIARATLSSICHAIGKLQLANTADLLGESVQVKLKVVPASGNYEAKNDVSGYRPAGVVDAEQSKPAAAPAVAKPAQAAAPRTAGWKRP